MLCVIAKLDPEATEKLRFLQAAVHQPGDHFLPLYGHITLAACISGEEAAFIRDCEPLIRGTQPFPVLYRSVDVLRETSIVAASPEKSGGLLHLHDRIAERFGAELDTWTAGDSWRPHTTLLYDPESDLQQIRGRAMEVFAPFETVIRQIEFSRADQDGYTILKRVKL